MGWIGRPRPRRAVDWEIEHYLAEQVDRLVARGWTVEGARREARRRFGDVATYRKTLGRIERGRQARERGMEALLALKQNVTLAFRALRRAPAFSLGIVLTLALGIGANAAMFGILDRLFLSPPAHVRQAERVGRLYLHRVWQRSQPARTTTDMSYPAFLDFRQAASFQAVAAMTDKEMVLGRGPEARKIDVQLVTPSFFSLLGVGPAIGRFFDESEDQPGAAGVTVLSHAFWLTRFGGSPDAVGRALTVGSDTYTVVGVAPPGFTGVDLGHLDLWLPLDAQTRAQGSDFWRTSRDVYFLRVIARLRDGASREDAETETTGMLRNARRDAIAAGRYPADARIIMGSIMAATGPGQPTEVALSRWLTGVTLVVLLVACANVANLLLARGAQRRRELGMTLALGISRRRLFGQLLVESLVLAALGGAAGLLVALWGGEVMRAFLLPDVEWASAPVDARVLAFTGGLAALTGLLAGSVPAWQATRGGIATSLKDGGGAGRRSRTQTLLMVAQGALSVVLLVGAGLFVLSFQRARHENLGFDARGLGLVELEFESGTDTAEQWRVYAGTRDRILRLPGVTEASLTTGIPFGGMAALPLFVPGLESIPAPPGAGPFLADVSSSHFATLGMPIVEGRAFTDAEERTDARVAVVSRNMARGIWGDTGALGQCFKLRSPDDPCWEVVGVVADSHLAGVADQERWQYFLPAGPRVAEGLNPRGLFFRTAGGDDGMLSRVRGELKALDPRITIATVQRFEDVVDADLRSWKLGRTLFSLFGVLALVVAGIGLYSVLAFTVARRRREIGVRSALGASRAALTAMIVREAVGLTSVGIGLGLTITLLTGERIAPLLFDTSPREPFVLAGVTAVLLVTALVSGAVPAWAAGRVDPVEALRAE